MAGRHGLKPGITARALRLARPVRLLVLDVDGVLTNNTVYVGGPGQDIKRFGIQDGMGIKLAQSVGIDVAVISGLGNSQAEARLRQLGVREFHGGHLKKLPVLESLLAGKGLSLAQTAYMGDDWLDGPILAKVGLPMTVPGAQPEIVRLAAWMSRQPGGNGAVREAIRFLLLAQGKLEGVLKTWRD